MSSQLRLIKLTSNLDINTPVSWIWIRITSHMARATVITEALATDTLVYVSVCWSFDFIYQARS